MSSQRPQDLVFTLFGDSLLHRPGPVWVGSLIALLAPFGLSEGAVRTVLSRMAAKGWLATERKGRRSFYDLTPRGRRLLEAGAERIYHPSWDQPWDGRWFLLAYSIPEESRSLRDRLRDRLAWLGFGSLGNGLWISPHDVEEQVREIAASLDLVDHLECFRGLDVGFSDPARLVARCWDLTGINARYEAFIGSWVPVFEGCRAGLESGRISGEECYVHRFTLMHEYREFPLLDPYLPRALLPEDWGGECAAHLFQVLHDMLQEPADRYVDSVLDDSGHGLAPTTPGRGRRRKIARTSI